MKKSKISKDKIISLIKEEAEVIKRKREIYKEVKKLNEELKEINENRGIAGTFGFKSDVQKNNDSVSGFEITPNISYIAQLEKEFGMKPGEGMKEDSLNEDELNEISTLKAENESLKEKLNQIEEALKTIATAKGSKK